MTEPGRRSGHPPKVAATRPSPLERSLEIKRLGAGSVDMPDVPPAKVAAMARYGLSANAPALRELSARRRAAALLATRRQLEKDAVDDVLDLFDLLMATRLLAKAERRGEAARPKTPLGLRRAAVNIASAVPCCSKFLTGGDDAVSLAQAWEQISG